MVPQSRRSPTPLPLQRLQGQLLAGNAESSARAVVSHLGAMQAQDYLASLWAIGSRMRSATESAVEEALARREIVRCWPMRGTLHCVAAEDARWMLELLAPRVLTRHRNRLERDYALDAKTRRRARAVVERLLGGGRALTRGELYAKLEEAHIDTASSRGLHLIFTLAHELVLCFGARRGKQPTFVLLNEWLPQTKPRSREESLAELARRYFASHGPATIPDFVWWSGLTRKEAVQAIALAELDPMEPRAVGAAARRTSLHLLAPFDEFTVAYKDRGAILDPAFARQVNAGGGIISAIVVIDGVVAGRWKRTLRGSAVDLEVSPFRELTEKELRALQKEAQRYGAFIGAEAVLRFAK